jgi:hypothetical protein
LCPQSEFPRKLISGRRRGAMISSQRSRTDKLNDPSTETSWKRLSADIRLILHPLIRLNFVRWSISRRCAGNPCQLSTDDITTTNWVYVLWVRPTSKWGPASNERAWFS